MKGLLRKELYLIWKYCRALLVIVAAFIAVSWAGEENSFFLYYPCVIAGMLPVTLYSYDERDGWCAYSAALPVSRGQYVSAKYLVGLLAAAAAALLAALAQSLQMGVAAGGLGGYFGIAAGILAGGLAGPAITLPFVFRFGAEKGRIAYYMVILLLCVCMTVLGNASSAALLPGGTPGALLAFLAAAVLYGASWLLSIAFYQKRAL